MNRLTHFASIGLAILMVGCNFDEIEIPDLTGNQSSDEVAVGDSPNDAGTVDSSNVDVELTNPVPDDSELTAVDESESTPVPPDGSDAEPINLPKDNPLAGLGKQEAEIAASLIAAGAKIKVENNHVTELSCHYAVFKPEMYEKIYQLVWLKSLDLEQSNVDDNLLIGVENLKQLKYINLDDTQITDVGMGHLVLKGTPTWIDADATHVTGNTLDGLIKSGKRLTIRLAEMSNFPDDVLAAAAKVSKNRIGFVSDTGEFGEVEPKPAIVAGREQVD